MKFTCTWPHAWVKPCTFLDSYLDLHKQSAGTNNLFITILIIISLSILLMYQIAILFNLRNYWWLWARGDPAYFYHDPLMGSSLAMPMGLLTSMSNCDFCYCQVGFVLLILQYRLKNIPISEDEQLYYKNESSCLNMVTWTDFTTLMRRHGLDRKHTAKFQVA